MGPRRSIARDDAEPGQNKLVESIRSRSGDPAEWARLLEEFRPYLLSIAQVEFPKGLARRLGPSDLVQLTLTKGHLQAVAFRGQTREELARWLRQILLNHLTDAARQHARKKRQIGLEQQVSSKTPDKQGLSPSGEALSREEQTLLELALSRISPQHRLVVEWRHQENLSFMEIGARLGKSDEAARKLWTRAIRKLQQELNIHVVESGRRRAD